jgi:hypothetical protein
MPRRALKKARKTVFSFGKTAANTAPRSFSARLRPAPFRLMVAFRHAAPRSVAFRFFA